MLPRETPEFVAFLRPIFNNVSHPNTRQNMCCPPPRNVKKACSWGERMINCLPPCLCVILNTSLSLTGSCFYQISISQYISMWDRGLGASYSPSSSLGLIFSSDRLYDFFLVDGFPWGKPSLVNETIYICLLFLDLFWPRESARGELASVFPIMHGMWWMNT